LVAPAASSGESILHKPEEVKWNCIMKQQTIKTSDEIARKRNFTLLELLDRLLDKGVMVKGEILLSVADIDLVYLNLGLLLSSVKSIEAAASRGEDGEAKRPPWHTSIPAEFLGEPQLEAGRSNGARMPLLKDDSRSESGQEELLARALPTIDAGFGQYCGPKTNIDPDCGPKANIDPKNIEKGLAKLVLTLVDLLRRLMEKQAIRRMEAGQLNFEEVEKMGNTFLLLDERMEQLKETFGLKDEELNLDLGPLGELL
jgi:Gas vesicle protein K/Gas vesicle protein